MPSNQPENICSVAADPAVADSTYTVVDADCHDEPGAQPCRGVDEEAVFRKVNRRVLPFVCFIVLFCYLDRTNLAYASLQINEDLSFDAEVYGLGSGLFFLGYALFQVPSNIMLVRVGAHRWLALILVVWGVLAASFAAISSPASFYTLRFLLGLAESGAFPGIFYYLTLFYPASRITMPYVLLEVCILGANIVSGPLAAALLHLDGLCGLDGWQWLFVCEGIPSVLLGLLLLLRLPANPSHLSTLTPDERTWLTARLAPRPPAADSPMKRPCNSAPAPAVSPHPSASSVVTWHNILAALSCWRMWCLGTIKFLKDVANWGLFFWFPALVKALLHPGPASPADAAHNMAHPASHGHGAGGHASLDTRVVLLTAVPYALAAAASMLTGWHAERRAERHLYLAGFYAGGGVMIWAFTAFLAVSPVASYLLLVLAVVGLYAPAGICLALVSSYMHGPVAAVGFALYNSYGALGGVVGPVVVGFVVEETESYVVGMLVMGLALVLAGGLALGLRHVDARARRGATGFGGARGGVEQGQGEVELGGLALEKERLLTGGKQRSSGAATGSDDVDFTR